MKKGRNEGERKGGKKLYLVLIKGKSVQLKVKKKRLKVMARRRQKGNKEGTEKKGKRERPSISSSSREKKPCSAEGKRIPRSDYTRGKRRELRYLERKKKEWSRFPLFS